MYTDTGRNHINLHTAGLTTSVATHIAFGIDHLNTVGDAAPLLTDRYAGAFESVRIPIINTTVIDGDIIFATSYDTAKVEKFIGNVMALIYENADAPNRQRIRKNVFNNFTDGWYGGVELTTANTPVAWFSRDGGMILDANTTATIEGAFSLAPFSGNDFMSVPVFFYGAAPTGGVLTMTFTFKVAGVDTTYSISDTVSSPDGGTHFKFAESVPALNDNGAILTTTLLKPDPHVFQRRLDSGTLPADFLANLATIWKVELNWTCSQACQLYVGSPQITPDFDADNSNIVVAYGELSAAVAHSGQSYMSAEYRIPGV